MSEKKTRKRKTRKEELEAMQTTELIAEKRLVDEVVAARQAAIEAELKLVEGMV